jgi:hypothetical protein
MIRSVAEIEADYLQLYPTAPKVHDYPPLQGDGAQPLNQVDLPQTPPPRFSSTSPLSPFPYPDEDPPFTPLGSTSKALSPGCSTLELPSPCHTAMCGAQGNAALNVIHCGLCQHKWHIACVAPKYLSANYDPRWDDDGRWCCPQCTEVQGGRWDQAM